MQENPRINRQDRQKITFHRYAYPKEISQQCTPATHTEAVHCQRVLLGVFHPCLWPLKASGSTLGGGSTSLSSALWRQFQPVRFLEFSGSSRQWRCHSAMYWCLAATCHTLVMRCNLWTHCLPDQWVPANNMKLHSHVNSAPHPFPMSHDYRHQLGQVHNEWLDKYKKTMLGICARALFFMTAMVWYSRV